MWDVAERTALLGSKRAGTTIDTPPIKEDTKQTETSTVLPKEEADFIAELYASAARDKATQEAATKPVKDARQIEAAILRTEQEQATRETLLSDEVALQEKANRAAMPLEEMRTITQENYDNNKATLVDLREQLKTATKGDTSNIVFKDISTEDASSNTLLLPANRFATRQAQEDRISDLQEVVKGGLEPDHPAPIKGMNDVKAELAALETSRLPPETREHYKTDIESLETQASDILFKADAATNRGDNVAAKQFEAESNGIQARADELRAKMPEANIKNKVAPTPKELDDFLWETTTVTQALDKIHAANIGGKASLVLNRLIRNHQSIADTLFKSQKEPLIYDGEAIGGYWEHKANRVTLGPNAENGMATFYHEILHPIIQNVLKDNTSRAAIRLEQLWKEVKDAKTGVIDPLTGKPHYGFTDKFEFLAEAYTNASFQRLLQGITYPTTTPGKFTTAWNALKEIIKDAIGAKDAATRSALDEVLEVGSRVIEQNRKVKYEYRPDNNEVVSKSAPTVIKDSTLPEEVKAASKGIDVRSIANEAVFLEHAKKLLVTEGEEATKAFFRAWKKHLVDEVIPVAKTQKELADTLYLIKTWMSADLSRFYKEHTDFSKEGLPTGANRKEKAAYTKTIDDIRDKVWRLNEGQKDPQFLAEVEKLRADPKTGPLLEKRLAESQAHQTEIRALIEKAHKLGGDPKELNAMETQSRYIQPTRRERTLTDLFGRKDMATYGTDIGEIASAMRERTLFQLEDGRVVQVEYPKEGGIPVIKEWKDGKPSQWYARDKDPSTGKPAKTGPIKSQGNWIGRGEVGQRISAGDTVNIEGKSVKIVHAKTHEVERHTGEKYTYIKDSQAVEAMKLMELRNMVRVMETMESLKASNFLNTGRPPGTPLHEIPLGFKQPTNVDRLPQLQGWVFDPKSRGIIEDFAKVWEPNWYLNTSSMLIKNMMLNPFPHMMNEMAHLWNLRGLSGWTTVGGVLRLKDTSVQATKDVMQQTDFYRQIAKEGGSLLGIEPRDKS